MRVPTRSINMRKLLVRRRCRRESVRDRWKAATFAAKVVADGQKGLAEREEKGNGQRNGDVRGGHLLRPRYDDGKPIFPSAGVL